jgi:oligopeptide transport system substrate-binding protein
MRKKNLWLVLGLVAVLMAVVGLAAACGSGTETTTTSAGATTTTAAGTGTTAAGGTTTTAAETSTTAAAGATPVEGGVFAWNLGEPSFIDPDVAFESEGAQVDNQLFDRLAKFNYKTSELEPNVATSWDVSADGLTWTFHLKKDSTFSNGRAVVAADFKYGWERLTDPAMKSNYQTLLSMVKGYDEMTAGTAKELSGVVATDPQTLTVTLAKPFADFAMITAMVQCSPVPKEEIDKDAKAYAEQPIGNGPFKMSGPWQHNQLIQLVKRDDYSGTKPHIDGIDFKIYKDDATAFLDYKAGNLDKCNIPSGQYKDTNAQYGTADDAGLTANPGHQTWNGPELGIYEIVINNQNDLFKNNQKLREAISLAINRQAISDAVFEGLRKPATSIIPEGTVGYEANAFPYSKYDVEAAKKALADAGYPGGQGLKTFTLSYNNNASHEAIMQLVQADLKAIGINTTLDGSDAPSFWDKEGTGGPDFYIGRSGWIADYPTIDNFIFNLYYSTAGNNFSHVKDPAVDKAIVDARSMADPTAALAAEQAAVKLIGATCPDAPVMYYTHDEVASERVNNLTYSPLLFADFVNCWLSK